MKSITRQLKRKLYHITDQMAQNPSAFVMRPGKDFSRNRLLPFDEVLKLLCTMGGQTLNREIYTHFENRFDGCPTASAFIQQRDKIKPEAVYHAFLEFKNRCGELCGKYFENC